MISKKRRSGSPRQRGFCKVPQSTRIDALLSWRDVAVAPVPPLVGLPPAPLPLRDPAPLPKLAIGSESAAAATNDYAENWVFIGERHAAELLLLVRGCEDRRMGIRINKLHLEISGPQKGWQLKRGC